MTFSRHLFLLERTEKTSNKHLEKTLSMIQNELTGGHWGVLKLEKLVNVDYGRSLSKTSFCSFFRVKVGNCTIEGLFSNDAGSDLNMAVI